MHNVRTCIKLCTYVHKSTCIIKSHMYSSQYTIGSHTLYTYRYIVYTCTDCILIRTCTMYEAVNKSTHAKHAQVYHCNLAHIQQFTQSGERQMPSHMYSHVHVCIHALVPTLYRTTYMYMYMALYMYMHILAL